MFCQSSSAEHIKRILSFWPGCMWYEYTDKARAKCVANNLISGDQQIKPLQMDISKQNSHYNIVRIDKACS